MPCRITDSGIISLFPYRVIGSGNHFLMPYIVTDYDTYHCIFPYKDTDLENMHLIVESHTLISFYPIYTVIDFSYHSFYYIELQTPTFMFSYVI